MAIFIRKSNSFVAVCRSAWVTLGAANTIPELKLGYRAEKYNI